MTEHSSSALRTLTIDVYLSCRHSPETIPSPRSSQWQNTVSSRHSDQTIKIRLLNRVRYRAENPCLSDRDRGLWAWYYWILFSLPHMSMFMFPALPRFEVKVNIPSYALTSDEYLTGSIKARWACRIYPFLDISTGGDRLASKWTERVSKQKPLSLSEITFLVPESKNLSQKDITCRALPEKLI